MNIFFNKSRTLCTRNSVDTDVYLLFAESLPCIFLRMRSERKKTKEKPKNICVRVNRFQDSFSHYILGRRRCLCVPVLFRSFCYALLYLQQQNVDGAFPIANFFSLATWLLVQGHYYCYSRMARVLRCACDSLLLAPEFNNIITSLIPSHSTTVPHASGVVSRRCLRTIFNFALNIYNANRIKITFEPFGGFRNSEWQKEKQKKRAKKKREQNETNTLKDEMWIANEQRTEPEK